MRNLGRLFGQHLAAPTLALLSVSCSCQDDSQGGAPGDASADAATGAEGGGILTDGATAPGATLTPADTTLTWDPASEPAPSVTLTVTGASPGSRPVFRVTNGAVGSVNQSGVFTASGKAAGETEIEVTVGGEVLRARVVVKIDQRQNGGPASTAADIGAGGLGGVGGEGFGAAVTDELRDAFAGAATSDPTLTLLYPYDRTVFPLGVLPPLLQWSRGSSGTIDAVRIRLSAGPHFRYEGLFGRPALLGANAPLVRHPIARDVWDAATLSAAGGEVEVEVTPLADGAPRGPLTSRWKIALAPARGRVYYQAYNTDLAENYGGTTVSGRPMGGATLSIVMGEESPTLVAGRDSADHSGCRVCHSVSAYGDRMIVQHGEDYTRSSAIDLKNGNAETTPFADGLAAWAGLSPDGTLGLASSVDVGGPRQASGALGLFDVQSGAAVPSTGLAEFATSIALPAFSHDGKTVAFTLFGGPSTPAIGEANGRKLVAMDFDRARSHFSNPRLIWEAPAADQRPGFVSFLPTSGGVVFQRRWEGGNTTNYETRYGARGELWWADLTTGQAAPLASTNGVGADGMAYLPEGPSHEDDETLSYEPSVSPVASGGYAWMVFLSRRRYGNVADAPPWDSDTRDHDLERNVTTKKIWMAAIDLDAKPGEDPSHPAFYIPGQELRGVNSRPFFALEPCVTDRGTCSTGIDCCTGFCRDGYCSEQPVDECARTDERCESTADCCAEDGTRCLGGYCAVYLQ